MEHEQLGALANGEQMRSHLFLLSLDFGCLQRVDVFCFSSQGQGGETAYTILEYKYLYPSNNALATGKQCSTQGKVHLGYQNDYFRKGDCS